MPYKMNAQSFKHGCLKAAALSCHTMWQPKRLTRHGCETNRAFINVQRMHDSGRTKSLHDAPTPTTANARMRDSACPKFRTMRNQQSKHDVQGCTIAVAQSRRKDAPTQTTAIRQPRYTFARSTSGVYFFWCWGANSHGAGKARMPYKMNAQRL